MPYIENAKTKEEITSIDEISLKEKDFVGPKNRLIGEGSDLTPDIII
jgi:hypothetical protein